MDQLSAFAAYKAAAIQSKGKKSPEKSKKNQTKKVKHINTNNEKPSKPPKRKMPSENSETPKSSSKSQDSTISSNGSEINMNGSSSSNVNGHQPQKKSKHDNNVDKNSQIENDTEANWRMSSVELGEMTFRKLICGVDFNDFMKIYWERKPLYISRSCPQIYKDLKISTAAIDQILRDENVEYTTNLDITSYENGVRETLNPDGRATAHSVWDFYNDGCSVRLLNPQVFMPRLHQLNATLQELFRCFVGANLYLTPAKSQGFAPHYDDIEAFILQIEGKKRWRIYHPIYKLPRESSGNFTESDVAAMKLSMEVILEPGDLLYFPRGWIHQANTIDGHHSLHVTLSAYQKNSFADLFGEMAKQMVTKAIESEASFRYGLPVDIWTSFGTSFKNLKDGRKEHIKAHIEDLFERLLPHIDIDEIVDRLAVKFQHDALPPVLSDEERKRTASGSDAIIKPDGRVVKPELQGNTEIRLLRASIVRVTSHDNENRLYFHVDNPKEYHAKDVEYIVLDDDDAVQIANKLVQSYPNFIKIRKLHDNFENALSIARAMWDRGLIMTKKPL